MPEPLQPALDAVRSELLDPARLVRAVAAGRRRGPAPPPWRRAELRWVEARGERRLQAVTYDERQAFTRTVPAGEAAAAVDELLGLPFASWHVETAEATTQLRVTKRGEAQVHRGEAQVHRGEAQVHRAAGRASPAASGRNVSGHAVDDGVLRPVVAGERAHDRVKRRLLDPVDPLFRALGIADASGSVKPSRYAKYRQVEDFLRALDPVLPPALAAAGEEPLRVADLGCGNAYLTFAAQRLLAARGVAVELAGVDVRAPARERNARLAHELGIPARFVAATIAEADLDPPPHLVLALHACDTATDDALARALGWRSAVVVAAPCCHHDLHAQLRRQARDGAGAEAEAAAPPGGAPPPYGLITRYGLLREHFADTLTDALRAALLRMTGHRVDVLEFVDPQHTPRNVLLRAVRTGAAPVAATVADYRSLVAAWGVVPALEQRLRADAASGVADLLDGVVGGEHAASAPPSSGPGGRANAG